jgi:hypothetical protein
MLNFPLEEQGRVRHFAGFMYDVFLPEVRERILSLGGQLPGDILRKHNYSFDSLDIDKERL